ncbi:MAG: hypothetical protein GF404_05530 [candidate division Zixibacteria bacterium]|nr:hypothetical protein [candidate division Zixibacteria bacterium]
MNAVKMTLIATILALILVTVTASADDVYISGFLQGLYGGGLHDDNPVPSDLTASETRLQMKLESYRGSAEFFGRLDFYYDGYNESEYDWELREGYIKFRMGAFDFKIGRQVLTWGTGDLIFINDNFAKDYQSFFIGRDDQYLKAPQDALRAAWYSPLGALDVVWTPKFTPNRVPTGLRLSYYNPLVGDIVGGEQFYMEGREPETEFKNSELSARLKRYFGTADIALYFYKGFYKNPEGMDMATMEAYYPELFVYGASMRMPIFEGIFWVEGGYSDSRDDPDGDITTIPNSEIAGLAGFERQVANNLTANIQYQAIYMVDYDKFEENVGGQTEVDEVYHLLTSRITQLLRMETVVLSGFVFYSPSQEDVYFRFSADYKYNDALTLTLGGNIFDGTEKWTDFGTFMKNDNLYFKATYGF